MRGQLLRDGRTRDSGIGGHEADFVDVNVRIALQSGLQLFGELHRFGTSVGGKTAHEARQTGLRDFGRKVNAGDPSRGKHAREAFFGGGGFERRSVEKELVTGNREEHAGFIFGAGAESGAQFGPGSLVLFFGARMAEVIHARELEQDVEAADKGAGRSGPDVGVRHVYVGLR